MNKENKATNNFSTCELDREWVLLAPLFHAGENKKGESNICNV